MSKNLVVLSKDFGTEKVFSHMFDKITKHVGYYPFELSKDDVILFEGGTDINPSFYGEKRNSYTDYPDVKRDAFEKSVFEEAKQLGIPMIGICRGSQLLCALSGGKLAQHVDNHTKSHIVKDYLNREYLVTSTHHQMMLPAGTSHIMLASTKLATYHLGENDIPLDVKEDAEVVWFKDTKSLAIQFHPEFMHQEADAVKMVQEYVSTFIFEE